MTDFFITVLFSWIIYRTECFQFSKTVSLFCDTYLQPQQTQKISCCALSDYAEVHNSKRTFWKVVLDIPSSFAIVAGTSRDTASANFAWALPKQGLVTHPLIVYNQVKLREKAKAEQISLTTREKSELQKRYKDFGHRLNQTLSPVMMCRASNGQWFGRDIIALPKLSTSEVMVETAN